MFSDISLDLIITHISEEKCKRSHRLSIFPQTAATISIIVINNCAVVHYDERVVREKNTC